MHSHCYATILTLHLQTSSSSQTETLSPIKTNSSFPALSYFLSLLIWLLYKPYISGIIYLLLGDFTEHGVLKVLPHCRSSQNFLPFKGWVSWPYSGSRADLWKKKLESHSSMMLKILSSLRTPFKGLFWWSPVVKIFCFQCRGFRFNPWSGN